jgi:UDP-GlcNAc:undecaprenyl-phosphate GlcNAc-1-phosphate transferase
MKIITTFFISFILSFVLTLPTIYLAKKLNLVTDKRKRKHPAHTHFGIIPRAGGLPIYLAIVLTVFLIIPINKILTGILIASLLLVVVGLLDDYYDLSPYYRFIANLLISSLVIGFGLGVPYISNPFGGVIRLDNFVIYLNFLGEKKILFIADLLAVIWLTLTTNLINWSKGVDGQMPGFVGIAAIFLGILSQRFTAHDISVEATTLLSFAIAGAFLGFLPWNFYPQKIMPGYSGGALAGFLLGILSILSFGKLGTFLLILSVPIIDGIYTIIRRILQKKSPFRADWGHFHHRLLEIGWGKRRVAVFYWLITLIFGLASLFLKGWEKLVFSITIAFLLIVFMYIIEKIKIPKDIKV